MKAYTAFYIFIFEIFIVIRQNQQEKVAIDISYQN